MARLRFDALNDVMNRKYAELGNSHERISDYYGTSVFHDKTMREFLPKDVYKKIRECIVSGKQLETGYYIQDMVYVDVEKYSGY